MFKDLRTWLIIFLSIGAFITIAVVTMFYNAYMKS